MSGYRRPRDSRYARGWWWAGHGAELVGLATGFCAGLLLVAVVEAVEPGRGPGWAPFLLALVGGIGLRWWLQRRIPKDRR